MVAVGDVPLKDHGQGVMDLIASDAVLDEAYAWLCDRRKDYSPHDDVMDIARAMGRRQALVAEKFVVGRVPL